MARFWDRMSSRMTPIDAVRPSLRRRLLAARFGRKSSCSIARDTRAVRSGETPGSALMTRETVLRLTPASAATSRMVGRGRARSAFDPSDNVVIQVTIRYPVNRL